LSIAFGNPPVAADGLEILDVIQDPGDRLRAHFRARADDERRLEIVGWVLGDEVAATEVVIVADGTEAGVSPVTIDRPDVAEKYPDEPTAATCGFRLVLAGEGQGQSRLELFAVLEDETREPLGRMLCRSLS
jgi:hypothetical protein